MMLLHAQGASGAAPLPRHHQRQQRRPQTTQTRVHKEWAAQGELAAAGAGANATTTTTPTAPALAPRRLSSATEAMLEALALLRHPGANPAAVAALFPPGAVSPQPFARAVAGGGAIVEAGPLARVGPGDGCLDACARRVLPGHLLRRCRVLSSLGVGGPGGRHLQRVALVAHSGEEALLEVEMRDEGEGEGGAEVEMRDEGEGGAEVGEGAGEGEGEGEGEGQDAAKGRSAGGGGIISQIGSSSNQSSSGSNQSSSGKSHQSSAAAAESSPLPPSLRGWRVVSMRRDASGDADAVSPPSSSSSSSSSPLAPMLRPAARVGPEAAVLAQLACLSRGDVEAASRWCSWARRLGSGAAWESGLRGFRETLRRPEFHALLLTGGGGAEGGGGAGAGGGGRGGGGGGVGGLAAVSLGAGALPSQRRVLQEVRLCESGGRERDFLWEMSMQDDGVWLVRSIVAVR